MNDKIKQRARELYANEWSKIDSHYAAGIRSGDILATPEIRAITAALNESAPKPEAQAAGLPWLLRERAQVAGVVTGELLNRAADALEALSTPASHDAQQDTSPEYRRGWLAGVESMRQELAQQPAVVGDGVREALQAMLDEKVDYMLRNNLGNPYAEHTTKQAIAALTPAATPGDRGAQEVAACNWRQEDEEGGWYNTDCGHSYIVNDNETGGLNFCSFCGKPSEFIAWSRDDEDAHEEGNGNG